MSFTTLQNTPIEIDLVEQGKSTGWTVNGTNAIHEQCNAGSMYMLGYPLTSGRTYSLTYRVNSISGGHVRVYAGDTAGAMVTTTGNKSETIVASGTDLRLRFYSNADLDMDIFNIKEIYVDTSLKKNNSIAWSEKINKWPYHPTYNPDCAFSMFTNLYSFKEGNSYVHNPNSGDRNNFYGVQYETIVKFVANKQPDETKTFEALEYKANTLLITTVDGITTSLGQVSDLIAEDFLQYTLNDGVDAVQVYDQEGNYKAGFLRDKNEDINNGSVLKGHYATIELTTTDNSVLKLFMVDVKSSISYS